MCFLVTIKAYRYYTPVYSFPLRRNELNHDPTEFTAKQQEIFSEPDIVKNPFSLFRQ